MIFRDYLLVGAVIATILWYTHPSSARCCADLPDRFFSNRVLLSPPSHSTPGDAKVEWAFAFDVHTNAFFPFYLTLYLAQLFLVPIVLKNNWICLFVSNTLYLAGYVLKLPYRCASLTVEQVRTIHLWGVSGAEQ